MTKKSDKRPPDHKWDAVLFQNYDLYDTGDPSPGTGLYQHMDEYDSVADFRNKKRKEKKRKRRTAMYEAIMMSTDRDHSFSSKKEKNYHLHKMLEEFTKLIAKVNTKIEDDENDAAPNEMGEGEVVDPADTVQNPIPWGSAPPGGSQIGILDGLYPKEDMDGNPPADLYYGRTEMHPVMAQKK